MILRDELKLKNRELYFGFTFNINAMWRIYTWRAFYLSSYRFIPWIEGNSFNGKETQCITKT